MTNFRFLLFTLLLLVFAQTSAEAQRTLGVKWEAPQNPDSAIAQLQQFEESGISVIEIQSKLTPKIWQRIDSLQFEVYGSFGIKYPVTSTFKQPDSALIRNIQDKASVYLSQPSVTAVGLFEFGATHKSSFFQSLKPIVDQLKESSQNSLYYTSRKLIQKDTFADLVLLDVQVTPKSIDTLSIPGNSAIGGYVYAPSSELETYLAPFKKFLKATSLHPDKPFFLHSSWLLSTLDTHPRLSHILHTVSTEPDAVFPLPRENLPAPSSSVLPIIILLVIWGTIGWHYNMSPLYRKALFRYFVAHKFFIDDIFQRQIRSIFPAFTIIVQNALLISACSFATFSILFTPLGQEAFFYHFPSLGIWGNTAFSIFIWTFLAALLVSLVSIIWLYITHRKIGFLTQITTIYAWPLQINFLLCTVAITLYSAGSGSQTIVVLTAIAILFLFLSFVFTSMDTLKRARSPFLHLIKTSIPYLLALGGLIIWILTKEQWLEVLDLSLYIK